MRIFIFRILVVMCVSVVSNAENVKLYKHYTFGMSKNTIKKEADVYDCSKSFEKGAVCIDNQKFVGESVDIGFRFINNKLVTVVLATESTSDNYIKLMQALSSRFQLVSMESDNKKIDFISQMKHYKKGIFLKNISDFEQNGLNNGNIKYIFIDKNTFFKLAKKSLNVTDLIFKANENARSVEYIIVEEENESYSTIQFSAPKKSIGLLKTKHVYEDF